MAETPGRQALAHVDVVLGKRPDKDQHALSAATMCLAAFRDAIIARHDRDGASPEERQRLAHVNAVISIVLAIHFELGSEPWPELEKARGWLAGLVAAEEPAAAGAGGSG